MHLNEQGSGVDSGALIARLLECHSRIREMLTMASGIVTVRSADEAREVAERLGRYFTRGLPLHTRDEEESILPRLAVGPDLLVALDRMQREHVQHESLVQELVTSCRDLIESPSRWQELSPAIAGAADTIAPGMVTHLLGEERDVFPHVERLDDAMQARILEEMEARRATGRARHA